MESTFYICADPQSYGLGVTPEQAWRYAEYIAERARQLIPEVRFVVVDRYQPPDFTISLNFSAYLLQFIEDRSDEWLEDYRRQHPDDAKV